MAAEVLLASRLALRDSAAALSSKLSEAAPLDASQLGIAGAAPSLALASRGSARGAPAEKASAVMRARAAPECVALAAASPFLRHLGARIAAAGGDAFEAACALAVNVSSGAADTFWQYLQNGSLITTLLPATMKWSRTRASIKANDSRNVRVRNSSARLGSATPDGWL
jgi:hypothetical protein